MVRPSVGCESSSRFQFVWGRERKREAESQLAPLEHPRDTIQQRETAKPDSIMDR